MKKIRTKIRFKENLKIEEDDINFNFLIKTNEQKNNIKLKTIDLKKIKNNVRDTSTRLF